MTLLLETKKSPQTENVKINKMTLFLNVLIQEGLLYSSGLAV